MNCRISLNAGVKNECVGVNVEGVDRSIEWNLLIHLLRVYRGQIGPIIMEERF
jgi:hypothetical protein